MNAKEALKVIEAHAKAGVGSAWFLHGNEPYKIEEFIRRTKSALFGDAGRANHAVSLAFGVDVLDGAEVSGEEVLVAIQSVGLPHAGTAQARLVLVQQAGQLKQTDSLRAALEAEPLEWGPNVLLLVSDSLDGRKKLHQWFRKKQWDIEFKLAVGSEVLQWAHYLAKKSGIVLDAEVAAALVPIGETALFSLAQEIEKLAVYSGEVGQTVDRESLAAIGGQGSGSQMPELVQAILQCKRVRALLLSSRIIQTAEEALGFVGFMTWTLRNSAGPRGILTTEQERMMDALIGLDQKLKMLGGGNVEPRSLVDQWILQQTSRP